MGEAESGFSSHPGGRTGSATSGGASAHRGRFLVAALVVLGLAGGALVLHNAYASSPLAVASNLSPKGPLTAASAGTALLRLSPGSVEGTNIATTVGIPLRRAMLEATGNPAGTSFAGRITVRSDRTHRGFVITVVLPVRVGLLLRRGEIRPGWLPGSSNLKTGVLSVTAPSGRVYGLRMNPKTDEATFVFDLARSDRNVASLDWNANGVIAQTDGSDPFS